MDLVRGSLPNVVVLCLMLNSRGRAVSLRKASGSQLRDDPSSQHVGGSLCGALPV